MWRDHPRFSNLFVIVLLCELGNLWALDSQVYTEKAQALLQQTGVQGGLIVQLGEADPQFTAALGASGRLVVQALVRDAHAIQAARAALWSQGRYGRISVRRWSGRQLPYADNLVNLLVVLERGDVSQAEMMRVVAPGGWLVLASSASNPAQPIRKPMPDTIDDWTHYLHDAGNNAVAEDDEVGPPRYLQWTSGPQWCRSHEFASSVQSLVSDNGRLIGLIDEGIIGQPRGVPAFWTLIARDAFNGVLLWRRPCDLIHPQSLVAQDDRVYVTLKKNGPLSILDAATGKTLRTCTNVGQVTKVMVCEHRVILRTRMRDDTGKPVLHAAALNPDTGDLLWKTPVQAMLDFGLVAGSGRVCYCTQRELVCLSLGDGRELWRRTVAGDGKNKAKNYVMLYDDTVFLTGTDTRAFSLATSEPLWTCAYGSPHARNPPGLFGANGLIWAAWEHVDPRSFVWQSRTETRNGYDPQTGEVRKTVRVPRLVTAGHHIRCYPAKATRHYLLLNKRGVEFLDLQGSNHMRANWTRGACGFGMLPANGLLYAPPSQCFCYQGVLLTGLNALAAHTKMTEARGQTTEDRLEKGPSYSSLSIVNSPLSTDNDWPTYRHDPRRSGSIDTSLPTKLQRLWEISLCPPCETETGQSGLRAYLRNALTPPVAADGRLMVAEPDAHCIHAVDMNGGRRLWRFVADARIDSPPTLYHNLCIFGSTDGHVYCLSAVDGRLVWRFRAAPAERQVCVKGQMESAWPVHGSVLVRDDTVYCTAGRSSYLDGGITLYALDPRSGRVRHTHRITSPDPDVTKDGGRPFDMDGAKSDILVAGARDIYLFQNRFDACLRPQPMPRITKLGDRRCEPHVMTNDGFLDKTWFNRTYWTYSARWPGYYFTYRAPKSGQILVCNDTHTYALKVYTERRGHSPEFRPGSGYLLVADRNTTEPVLDVMDIGAEKGRGYSRTELPVWSVKMPIRAHGMVLARDYLYLVGPPDLPPEQGAYEAMVGQRGSRLRVVDTTDGSTVSELLMDDVPVFDGLMAAGKRLWMATTRGTLVCFGEKQ